MDEMSVEKWWNEMCGRENGRNPEKTYRDITYVGTISLRAFALFSLMQVKMHMNASVVY